MSFQPPPGQQQPPPPQQPGAPIQPGAFSSRPMGYQPPAGAPSMLGPGQPAQPGQAGQMAPRPVTMFRPNQQPNPNTMGQQQQTTYQNPMAPMNSMAQRPVAMNSLPRPMGQHPVQQKLPQQNAMPQPMSPQGSFAGTGGQQPGTSVGSGRRAYPQTPPQQNPYLPPGSIGARPSGPSGYQPQPQSMPGQPHMSASVPNQMQGPGGQPQIIQSATVPQFGGARPPQFGAPMPNPLQPQVLSAPGYAQPGPPQFGTVMAQQYPGAPNGMNSPMTANGGGQPQMNQMQAGMQNMNLGAQQSIGGVNRNQPVSVNLLQRSPPVAELETLTPPPNMSPQLSVAQSPYSICPAVYKRCTLNAIPQTPAALAKTKLPFGLLVTPYRTLMPGEEPVPVINPAQIVRCRRCRTYINPWIQFVEQGTRWKCNMCSLTNEVPGFFDWDSETRQQTDRMKRAELTHSVVEYIAPQEYMVRPPQPVVLMFVIDVSFAAVQSGMVDTVAKSILQYLDDIPNSDGRTKVGFIGVDNCLHFFNLNSSLSEPQLLVVPDIEDAFLPLPEDLLVTLNESRVVIEKLLSSLPNMFRQTKIAQNALGRALQQAYKMIGSIGGKIVVFQSSLPNLSDGQLKMREDPKLLGTPKEVTLLQPASPFYKTFAVDCSRSQIGIDLFAFTPQYLDLATLTGLSRVTGGSTYYYPTFNGSNQQDVSKFASEFQNFLSRPLALEAVLRVRASKGIRMTRFHGNFFLRSTDLLALPAVNPDNSYAIEMEIQDPLATSVACFQTALLHTNSNGERRIRVLTLTLPVTESMGDIFSGADQYAISTLLSKKAVEKCLSSHIEAARDEVVSKLCDIITSYKNIFTSSGQNSMLILPDNLKMLPLLVMAALKHTAFKTSGVVPSDIRAFAHAMMCVYPPEAFVPNVHARFWALHSMDSTAGTVDEASGQVIFPPVLNLSSEKLERHGLYLLDNGTDIFVWVGRAIAPELCGLVFGQPQFEGIVPGKTQLPKIPNDWNKRVNNLVANIKERRLLMMTTSPNVFIVKEDSDPNLRMIFLSHLIEDKLDSGNSYPLFLGYVREKLNKPGGMFG